MSRYVRTSYFHTNALEGMVKKKYIIVFRLKRVDRLSV